MDDDQRRVALIGLGVIGRGWAVVFARAGWAVTAFDRDAGALNLGLNRVAETLRHLASEGLAEDPDGAISRIRGATDLDDAVAGAALVQESAPEDLGVKTALLARLDALTDPDVILASSCSGLAPDDLFAGLAHPDRCLVAHPFNPAYLMPLVELLPGARTSHETMERTRRILTEIGQTPVIVRKAVPGYVANRLQAAVINEAMHLVRAGVISPADLDLCMTEGLGRRWAFMGPFETMDLNADDGVSGYAARFQSSYESVGRDLKVGEPWGADTVETVIADRRRATPLGDIAARQAWRDAWLGRIDLLRRKG